ncbi:MAG: diguanylate cyclase [Oscillospiraceae bacterium]|nr:diguanylate cyclase [Oscillospiraceae bacterium]
MKVKSVIMLAAIAFAIIPMVIFTALNAYFISQSSSDAFRSEVISEAENVMSALDIIVNNAKNNLEAVSNIQSIQLAANFVNSNVNDPRADDFLDQFVNESPMVVAARLIDSGGNIIAGTNSGERFASFEGYKTSPNDTLVFDAISGDSQQNSTMFIKKPVGNKNCILVISYNINGSNSIISRVTGNAKFLNGKGTVLIVDSNGNWSAGNGFNKDIANETSDAVWSAIRGLNGNVSDIVEYTASDGTYYYASMSNAGGPSGLYAVARSPESNVVNSTLATLVVATAVIAVLAIVAAVIVSTALTRPLAKIEDTLEYIRNGDHEARIGNVATNEYGQLSRAFNNVIDEIVVSEDRYKNISEMSDNIIFEWNFKTNEVIFSNNFNKKFSYRAQSDHFGDSFLLKAKLHPDDVDRYRHDLDQLEKGVAFTGNEYRIKNIYGDFIWVLMRTEALKDKDGKAVKIVGVMVDIDRAKKSEEQLTERASFDALTELYNRETIENQINNEISLAEVRKSEMAVLFVDVDDFKHFNDNYSHAVGDEVLKFVARTIKSEVDNNVGFAGRYGGDEFIVMVRNSETNNPAKIAERIIAKLSSGFDAQEADVHLSVSVSIGIAVIKDDYNTRVEYLIGKADDAMYSVKKSGKSNYAFIRQ